MEPTVTTVVELFQTTHQKLRAVVRDLDNDALNWSPGPDLNSVAVLVIHTLGSELDTLMLVRNLRSDRDRDAEFRVQSPGADSLLAAIDRADALLEEHGAAITEDDLAATRTRPGRDPQTGLSWLINNYGHAREHVGHLDMTVQLHQRR